MADSVGTVAPQSSAVSTAPLVSVQNVDYTLKPGQTEYRGYSTELKQWAYYSKMEMEYATCVIE